MTTTKLSVEDIEKLSSIVSKIHFLKQQLENVVNDSISKELSEINAILSNVLNPFWEKEEQLEDEEYKVVSKIQSDNKFISYWSISLKANDFNKKFSKNKIYEIHYQNATPITFPKGITLNYLEMWKYAEQLIKNSGDLHHIFIEDFIEDPKKPGYYHLSTGS